VSSVGQDFVFLADCYTSATLVIDLVSAQPTISGDSVGKKAWLSRTVVRTRTILFQVCLGEKIT
jgi:hypothetical protein